MQHTMKEIHPLKKARQKLGYSQKMLAHFAGVGEATIQRAEGGLPLRPGQELSFIRFNPSTTVAQKGVDSVFLGEYKQAIELIDQSLKIYDPRGVSARARLIAMKAEAYLKIGLLDASIDNAKEALTLAQAVGLHKIVDRVMKLHAEFQQSRWKEEAGIIQLGHMLAGAQTETT